MSSSGTGTSGIFGLRSANGRGVLTRAKRYVVSQFGNPRGPMGVMAGLVMRERPSNQRRNLWTLELMQVTRGDRLLEIGYGPGFALAHLLESGAGIDHVGIDYVGIDRSRTMYSMARARNETAVEKGKATLLVGSVEDLQANDAQALREPFSKIFTINTVMFWQRPVETLSMLRNRMSAGGQIFITHQPRVGERTDAAALAAAERVAGQLRDAGFRSADIVFCRDLSPAAACVIGKV